MEWRSEQPDREKSGAPFDATSPGRTTGGGIDAWGDMPPIPERIATRPVAGPAPGPDPGSGSQPAAGPDPGPGSQPAASSQPGPGPQPAPDSSAGAGAESAAFRELVGLAKRLTSTLDHDDLVKVILDGALEALDADSGSVMLMDPYEQSLWIANAVGLPDDVVRTTVMNLGEGIAGWVAKTGQGMVINDPGNGERGRSNRAVRSALSVPMIGPDSRLYGIINVGSSRAADKYGDEDMARFLPVAELAALALHNSDQLEASRRLFLESVRTLVAACEMRDPSSRGHTEQVLRYAVLLARKIGMSEQDVRRVELASLLHDIGKTSCGDAPLVKGRPLSEVEQTLIRMHPKSAAGLLAEAPTLEDVVPIIFYHHERYDGTGYLEGLKGQEIPLGARVLAVADAFAAMTAARPYRPARSMQEALGELKRGSGGQFDPQLVEAFLHLADDTPEIFSHKG